MTAERCTCTIGVEPDCPEHGHGEEGARLTAGIHRHEEKYAAEQARRRLAMLREWDALPAQVKLGHVLNMMEDVHFPAHYIEFVRGIFYRKGRRR